jgi:8-oxo-dGTP pyrophosphatase MutT (NUDIX family)
MTKTYQKIQALIFRKDNTAIEYLILRRTPEKGSIWQPVTGNCDESDSTILESCTRELKEETGIDKPMRVIEDIHSFSYSKSEKEFEEHVFGVEVAMNQVITLQSEPSVEHSEYTWTSYDGAFELFEYVEQKEALNKLHQELLKEK